MKKQYKNKNLIAAVLVTLLSACGGGGGGGNDATSSNTESVVSVTRNYSNAATYPIADTVVFRSHTTGDIFKLSDSSAWQILGTSNSGVSAGRVTSNVVISLATSSTPAPTGGVRSNYYLVGSDITPAFYVKPFAAEIFKKGSVAFRSQMTGDVFLLSDGSTWQITGTSNSGYSTGTIQSSVTIYVSSPNIPDPVAGIRSNYYLIGDGINPAFYIKPL